MKKISINPKEKFPFVVYEDDRETSCHSVEIEGPCKIIHADNETWVETEATVFKLINVPTKNIDIPFTNDIIDIFVYVSSIFV